MYQMVRPTIALPVHGETRHLLAQARLAEQCQVPQTIVTRNGKMVKLAPGPALPIGEVPVGRLVVDGTQLIAASSEAIKSRQRLVFNGAALASLVMDKNGKLMAPPQVTVPGLGDNETDDLGVRLAERVTEALNQLTSARPPRGRRGARGRAFGLTPLAQGVAWQAAGDRDTFGEDMSWVEGIVVYVLIWWVVIFAVLPFWVRTPKRSEIVPGQAESAPVKPRLLLKAGVISVASAVIWLIIWTIIQSDWISFRGA